MYDLISEYEITLANTRKMKKEKEKMIAAVKATINDQIEPLPLNELILAKEKLKKLEYEKSIISGMESDLLFAIDWMVTARLPGSVRGIERRSAVQQTKLIDPEKLQLYFSNEDNALYQDDTEENNRKLDSEDKERLEKALNILTKKQRQLFLLIKGQGFSIVETAKLLNISKQAAQQGLVRAERKLGEYISRNEGAGLF